MSGDFVRVGFTLAAGIAVLSCAGRAASSRAQPTDAGEAGAGMGGNGGTGSSSTAGSAGAAGSAGVIGDYPPCQVAADCPKQCSECDSGMPACAPAYCSGGLCGYSNLFCPTPACVNKQRNDPCQRCTDGDAGCLPGVCDYNGVCQESVTTCSPCGPCR